MGSLTTLTIYNDGAHLLKPHAQQFADGVYDAMQMSWHAGPQDVRVGNFVNCVHVQTTRFDNERTLYVHMDNCVTEMNAYSPHTKELLNQRPEFFEQLLCEVQRQARELLTLWKEHQAKQAKEAAE